MAELDATQMPEETTPSAEVNTTDLNTTEDTSPDLNTVEEPAVDQEPQGKPVSKEELAKRYLPKTRTSISTETSKIQTVAEPASTAVQKPVAAKPKSTNLLTQTQEEADKETYRAKKLEYELAPKGKKPEFKLDAKKELEDFLGGKIGSIDWNAYDKSKLKEEREAIKAQIEKDVDPNYDPSGVLTFINMITPSALKSGVASMGSQLAGFAGAAAQYLDKASKQSVAGAAFGETKQDKEAKEAKQTSTTEDLYKSLYDTAASLDKKSQDYMMVAEKNSGIKEENIGKGAFELLSSNKPGDTWDGLKKLGLSVTQQIPQLIALAATGGSTAGVMAGSTVLGTGGAITQEYKKDQDISVADAWKSVAKGIIEGATETLFMGDIKALRSIGGNVIKLDMSGAKKTMSDFLKERGRKALEQEISRTYFQSIKTIGKNSIGEGFEEFLASIGSFIVDRIEDGKWNQEEYDKLIKETQEAVLIGTATGFAASAHTIKTSVTPLTTEQKRKIISFRQVANDETVDKEVRKLAQKHADDIINYNADLATRKYAILSSLPIEKRKVALSIENKIKGLEQNKSKLKNVDAEAQVDKDIAKLKEDWSKVVVEHAAETAKADAKAKAEKIATAPKVMTSNSTEVSTATEAIEVDPSMVDADFDMLKGLSLEQKQTLVNILKAMNSINPDGKILLYANEAEMRQGLINSGLTAKEAYEKAASSSAEFTVKSSGADPVVHVNLANTDNAIRSASHEVAHLALLELSKTNPEAFLAMRDSVLRVMKNSQAKPLIDFASQYSAKLETAEANQERAEEFLAEMIGALTSGEGKIERTILDQLARIIRDFLLQASRSFGNKNLEDFINKTFADTTSSEALANYFESLAKQLKVGGKIDVSTLSDVIPLTPAQEARLQGLTPGTDAYHQAAMTNAVENSPSAARPTMEADQSLVQNPDDVVSRSQLAESNFIESPQFKKYLKVVKGMTPQDVWLGRALFMDENRGGKMFASGTKEQIIEQMKKEMDQIEADANNSNKYYITELKPPYIAAQIAKFEKDPALTDNLTEWKMIRDDASMRERYIKEKAAEQKASLTGNIAYLKGNDTYDVAFQYAMIKDGISSRYTVVPATEPGGDSQIQRDSIKPSQLNSTEKPIITMQPGIVASAYADYGNYNTEPGRGYLVAQINMPKIEVTASEFAPFIFKQSDTGEGTWLKFNQSSNKEDAKPLFKIASTSHKYPAQWCTGGALSTAEGHLRGGDFYIFVDAKTGDARIAVRYNGKNQISEVRGLGDGQSVLPEDGDIIDELVNTLPGGKEYKKDAEVQNTLKKILDSLPDEFSRKKFTLNYDDFNFWLRDQKVGTDEDERKIRIETGKNIKDAVIKIANDSFGSAQDAIDLINIKDKSYGQKNYALKNTKDVILNNVDDVFGNLGYEKGSVEKGFVAKDTITDTSKVRLILNDLYISDNEFPDFEYKFPLLENVTGKIVFDNKVYDNPIKVKASFPLLKNVKELKFDTVGDTDVKFDSLENIGEFGIKSNYKTETKIDFPKLKTIDSKENFVIHNKANVNAPLLEKISIGAPSSYTPGVLLITGDLNAPSLKTIDAKLEVYTDTDNLFKGKKKSFTFDNLESVAGLESVDANLSLPKLKYTGSILADNSSIKLNDISFDNIASFMASILANNNSYISINEISFNNEGGKGYKTLGIESQRGSEIVINNVTRQFGFSLTQGINSLKASEASQITILKGADQSWSDVEIESESAIKLPGVNKLKNVTLRNVRFSTNANEISKLTATNSEVTLPNAKNLFQFTLIDGGFIKAPNLKLLSEVSLFNITDNNNDKFDFGDFRSSGGSIELHNSELTIPNFTSTSNIFINNGRLSLPNATSIYGNVELAGGELSVPSMIRFRAAEKPIKMSYGSILNAPLLNSTTQQFELVGENTQSIQIFAPKLGYNGTFTPDPTLAKSQLAKDIETLDKAIQSVRMSPTVKYWMEPEFAPESQGIPKKGTPATVVFGKKDNPEGVSDFVAYYAENGNLVSVLNMLTQPKPGSESSKGAFKITVDPAQRRKGYAKLLLNAAQDNGLDIIGNVKNNRFSATGKDLIADWIKAKKEELVKQQSETSYAAKSQLAPNGKPSNLNRAQYETVRTPEFKAWFGDWENDPENASKFVDENGEPQVFYHGTYADFERFSTDPELKRFSVHNRGIFFTPTVRGAKEYGDIQMPVFLNAKTVDYNTANINSPFPVEREKENNLIDNTDKEGVVLKTIDKESITVGDKDGMVKQYVVFDPNQILLAGDKTYAKSQLAAPMYAGAVAEEDQYLPGTSAAKKAEEEADKPQSVKEVIQVFEKEFTERNVHLADFMKNADMMQSMYNMYNKAGATPWATRMFADAYRDVYGKVDGKKLSSRDKGFLDDVILLRRIIAIDENFDNRKEKRPAHTSFVDYETKKEVQLSKEEALRQLDLLKTKVYAKNPAKFDELEYRAEKYFEAFSGILKFKLDNGIITQDEYDMYKNYNYQPRKFLKFILADTKPEAFNTRGIQIKKKEFTKIESGDDGYMMTDSEKLLKMGFVSAVNQVFSNRAKRVIFDELAGRDLGWAKPAKVDTYANGTPKLEKDGSPKLLEPSTGYRNITFKVDGKRNAFQMKESLAKEFEDVEMYDLKNWFYKLSVAAMGAKLTSAMAVGISPAFILTNIPTDVFSQVHVNNLFNSRFGAPGQLVKGFAGTLAKSLEIAKAKTGLGDNSRILNLINDYGKLGGLQNTLSYDTNILGKVGDALGMLGDISELASKLNAFEKRRAGLLKDFIKKNKANPTAEEYEKIEMQAAYEARAAMDFNRGGRVTKFMNAFLPFLNVGAQATKLTTSYVKNHFPAFTKKIMQAGLPYMGLTLYNLMVAGDDWENEDLKRDKKNKIIIMSPYKNADGTHSYTKLQIPAAIKVFFNVFSIIAENIYYSQIAPAQGVKVPAVDKSMTKEMIDNLKMFVPAVKSTLMPPSAKFFSEYSNNESIFNERSLSQDALRKIIITEEGEENPDVLSLYKVLAKNTAQITKDTWMSEMGMIGRDGIEVSPERFQKAAEDSWFTSPESQALLSTMYLVADQMTNFVVGGVDEKIRSKYLGNGDYAGVMEAWAKSFKNRLIGKTDKKKNEFFYDMKEDMEMIESAQRKENSLHQDIAYKLKDIFKSYKALDLPYISAKPEVMEFYKSIKDPKDKEYAKNYIEMMIGNSQVELVNNIPKYRLILKEAKSARTKATAIYAMFTMRGQDPMTDKVLQKDLAKMGFSGEVVKQYKKIAKMEEAKKGVDVSDNIDPKTGLPPGFNPEDYK